MLLAFAHGDLPKGGINRSHVTVWSLPLLSVVIGVGDFDGHRLIDGIDTLTDHSNRVVRIPVETDGGSLWYEVEVTGIL